MKGSCATRFKRRVTLIGRIKHLMQDKNICVTLSHNSNKWANCSLLEVRDDVKGVKMTEYRPSPPRSDWNQPKNFRDQLYRPVAAPVGKLTSWPCLLLRWRILPALHRESRVSRSNSSWPFWLGRFAFLMGVLTRRVSSSDCRSTRAWQGSLGRKGVPWFWSTQKNGLLLEKLIFLIS